MKKYSIIMFMIIVCTVLFSCSNSNDDEFTETTEPKGVGEFIQPCTVENYYTIVTVKDENLVIKANLYLDSEYDDYDFSIPIEYAIVFGNDLDPTLQLSNMDHVYEMYFENYNQYETIELSIPLTDLDAIDISNLDSVRNGDSVYFNVMLVFFDTDGSIYHVSCIPFIYEE